jgi:hypothetical protein
MYIGLELTNPTAPTEVAMRMICIFNGNKEEGLDGESNISPLGSPKGGVGHDIHKDKENIRDSNVDISDSIDKNNDDKNSKNTTELNMTRQENSIKGGFFDELSQELRVFVASDTLNSLLVASSSNITAETLVLVQHCLNDIPILVQTVQSNLHFVCPASLPVSTTKRPGGNPLSHQQQLSYANSSQAQHDPVVTAFESELRYLISISSFVNLLFYLCLFDWFVFFVYSDLSFCHQYVVILLNYTSSSSRAEIKGLSKLGDTLYVRSWVMRTPYPRQKENKEDLSSIEKLIPTTPSVPTSGLVEVFI